MVTSGTKSSIHASRRSEQASELEGTHHRDKASLDIFWLKDESLQESDNLFDPDVHAQEIVKDMEDHFREIATDLGGLVDQSEKF